MSRELLSHFSLTSMPFDKEIATRDLLDLRSTKEALSTLRLLVETRGIGLLTGKSGTGKSCLIRKLLEELNSHLYRPIYLCHTSVGVAEFYGHLCVGLGLTPVGRKATMFRAIKDRILSLHSQSKIHPVLVIDEAHLLSNEVLSDLRLLANFEVDSTNALTILLCGQESLAQKFSLTALESLANSITVAVRTETLEKEDAFAYLEERIKLSGGHGSLFTKNAMTLIHQASQGVFRTLGTIATGALHRAMKVNSPQVEAEHVQAVIKR
ncbi:MAG: AAA family ATPase [Rectinemataceae bacterium]|nr:AAA family ATPase [Rectinemataceae bacterium]